MENYKKELAGAITNLADARATVDEYKAIIAKLDEIIATTNLGQQRHAARVALGSAKVLTIQTDAALRVMILAQFAIDADKHPHPAVTVKECRVVCVSDEQAVIQWGIRKGANFVKYTLNTTQLMKALSLFDTIPCAILTTQPRPTIATDLSAYSVLPGEEHEAL